MTPRHRPTILVLGPTAGGKTSLSIELARRLDGGGECCCADSMQVYRHMDIGTAKPDAAERAAAPHHLLDLVEPDEVFTVDDWLSAARPCIERIRTQGRWPIVVGGTNLYVQALSAGFMQGPDPDPTLRSELESTDPTVLRAELERVDPAAAERIHPNDLRRTIRAIEVHRLSGQPLSVLQGQWAASDGLEHTILIGLEWPVEAINRRINARVRSMMDSGFLDEVEQLHAAGRLGPQAREALGYKQLLSHLAGELDLDEAVEQIKIRTRRFAKQQRTWLRKFRHLWGGCWIEADGDSAQSLSDKALTYIHAEGDHA